MVQFGKVWPFPVPGHSMASVTSGWRSPQSGDRRWLKQLKHHTDFPKTQNDLKCQTCQTCHLTCIPVYHFQQCPMKSENGCHNCNLLASSSTHIKRSYLRSFVCLHRYIIYRYMTKQRRCRCRSKQRQVIARSANSENHAALWTVDLASPLCLSLTHGMWCFHVSSC